MYIKLLIVEYKQKQKKVFKRLNYKYKVVKYLQVQ